MSEDNVDHEMDITFICAPIIIFHSTTYDSLRSYVQPYHMILRTPCLHLILLRITIQRTYHYISNTPNVYIQWKILKRVKVSTPTTKFFEMTQFGPIIWNYYNVHRYSPLIFFHFLWRQLKKVWSTFGSKSENLCRTCIQY